MKVENLRDYQKLVYDNFIKEYHSGKRKNIVNCLPTGTGKSVIISAIVSYLVGKGKTIGIVVPTIELLDNLDSYFKRNYLSILVERLGSKAPNPNKKIYIGVYKTFNNRQSQLPKIDVYIHDECHHVACETWQGLILQQPSEHLVFKPYHVGFTATPTRLDGKPLWGFNEIYEPYPISWYMAKGYLCNNLVEYCAEQFVNVPDHTKIDNLGEQWESAKGKIHGSIVDSWLEHGNNGQTILYATTIEHCEILKESFNDLLPGINVQVITSRNTKKQRSDMMQAFRDKTIQILINVNVLTEGVDVPECSVVSAVRYWGNIAGYCQAVGRILRPSEGKRAVFIDHAGNLAHGSVRNIYGWTDAFYEAFEEYEIQEQLDQLKEKGVVLKPKKEVIDPDNSQLVVYNLSGFYESMVKAGNITSCKKMVNHWQRFLKNNKVTSVEYAQILDICVTVMSRQKAHEALKPVARIK